MAIAHLGRCHRGVVLLLVDAVFQGSVDGCGIEVVEVHSRHSFLVVAENRKCCVGEVAGVEALGYSCDAVAVVGAVVGAAGCHSAVMSCGRIAANLHDCSRCTLDLVVLAVLDLKSRMRLVVVAGSPGFVVGGRSCLVVAGSAAVADPVEEASVCFDRLVWSCCVVAVVVMSPGFGRTVALLARARRVCYTALVVMLPVTPELRKNG